MTTEEIIAQLVSLKESKNLSNVDLTLHTKIDPSTLSRILNGKIKPTEEQAENMVKAIKALSKGAIKPKKDVVELKIATSLSLQVCPLLYMFLEDNDPNIRIACFGMNDTPVFLSDLPQEGEGSNSAVYDLWNRIKREDVQIHTFAELEKLGRIDDSFDFICTGKGADANQRQFTRLGYLSVASPPTTKCIMITRSDKAPHYATFDARDIEDHDFEELENGQKKRKKIDWVTLLNTGKGSEDVPRQPIYVYVESTEELLYSNHLERMEYWIAKKPMTFRRLNVNRSSKTYGDVIEEIHQVVEKEKSDRVFFLLSEPLASWVMKKYSDPNRPFTNHHAISTYLSSILNDSESRRLKTYYVLLIRARAIEYWLKSPVFYSFFIRLTDITRRFRREHRAKYADTVQAMSYLFDINPKQCHEDLKGIDFRFTIDSEFMDKYILQPFMME